jgi:hypothetical protein
MIYEGTSSSTTIEKELGRCFSSCWPELEDWVFRVLEKELKACGDDFSALDGERSLSDGILA